MNVEQRLSKVKKLIVIEHPKPEVVYVPSYDPWLSTVRRRTRTRRSPIRLLAITLRAWRFRLELE